MYLWKIDKLKEELVETGLSQSDLFKYIFIYVFLSAVLLEAIYFIPGEEYSNIDGIQSIANILIIGLATYLCYFANGGKNGTEFAERYFSIGFVVAIRFGALLIPVMIAMGFIFWSGQDLDDTSTKWYDVAVMTIWSLLLYWRIIYHINQVAKQTNA